ncbi:MAG: hypothetical protein Q9176_003354 [Flavoplaca citrina]
MVVLSASFFAASGFHLIWRTIAHAVGSLNKTMASGAMADQLPNIRISSTGGTENPESYLSNNHLEPDRMTARENRVRSRAPTEARLTTNGKSFPNKLVRNVSKDGTTNPQRLDGRKDSQQHIDPLSQHIIHRTVTPNMSQPEEHRLRAAANPEETGISDPSASGRTSSEPAVSRTDTSASGPKDKKKGVKFLSRFIGSKKKEPEPEADEDDSQTGEKLIEGTDADVFSQPVGANGFIPRFPAPPKYIKVRSHGKKDKDFSRVFLAQQLRGRTGVEIAQAGGRLVKAEAYKGGDPKKDGNAIWAMDFSKDGKYLAAGGQDYLVRIWSVISTVEERRGHEVDEDTIGKEGEHVRLNAPVFRSKPVQEYEGHTASVLDLSWSKNNFLLSSSMDKTVRLWHVSRLECLCCFKHSDFVTSIQFHPRDDRFFLAGSLDSKLRLWSIPDKGVAYWSQLPDLITAVAFTPDGKTAVAGCLNGLCLFYETEGLKYHTQIHVRSAHGKNAKGSKVTGIQAINFPPEDPNGEVKILVTSNDSRVRVYNLRDKGLEMKLKGNENTYSQIRASFSEDARYIICGSEDRKAYIWPTGPLDTEKDKRPVEFFEAHSAIVTSSLMAPTRTRQLLSGSGDPLYDLCNPPPVTLISRSESYSSRAPTDNGNMDVLATPAISASEFEKPHKPEESPAYIARSAHPDGNIIVTADYMGHIKVFRQDCAYQKRLRNDANFSKKMLGRANSVATRHSNRSHRDSLGSNSQYPSSDRILSWRQSITNNNNPSLDSFRHAPNRSASPRKSLPTSSPALRSHGHAFQTNPSFSTVNHSPSPPSLHRSSADDTPNGKDNNTNKNAKQPPISSNIDGSADSGEHKAYPHLDNPDTNPLMLQGDQSYLFWNKASYRAQAASATQTHSHHIHRRQRSDDGTTERTEGSSRNSMGSAGHLGVGMAREMSCVSVLSSDEDADAGIGERGGQQNGEMRCRRCEGRHFRARDGGKVLVCGGCGEVV